MIKSTRTIVINRDNEIIEQENGNYTFIGELANNVRYHMLKSLNQEGISYKTYLNEILIPTFNFKVLNN